MKQIIVQKQKTKFAGAFVEALKEQSVQSGTFDSVAATDFVNEGLNRSDSPIPKNMQVLFDEVGPENSPKIVKAILDGVGIYEKEHGSRPSADLVEYALHMAYGTTNEGIKKLALDSATSAHADNLSLQPNRAVVAVLAALSEGIPWAHYLPVDIGSNQAKLGILTHLAGSEFGGYLQNGLMDGSYSGERYIGASRVHATTNNAGAHSGQLTSVQATAETCAAVAGNVVAVKLMRGRSIVYVNGIPCAKEVSSAGSGTSTVSGSITIGATTYQIGGTINTDTGVIAMTSTPALDNAVPVHVEGFIDFERQPEITPSMITSAEMFDIYAKPGRVYTQQTPDSRSQMMNELGIDPYQESLLAIQLQYANERHYELLWKAKRLAVNTTDTFDFDWTVQGAQKNRAQIIQDMAAKLCALSQAVTIKTLGFGISHIYTGANMAAQLMGLPRDLFTPSGIQERAGIYRVGRLFGRYDVYYTPKVVSDSASTSQMLCIGQAPDVARNPFLLGDAVPPTTIQLGTGTDFKQGSGFYVRNFSEVNPYAPSALGVASLSITNMGL